VFLRLPARAFAQPARHEPKEDFCSTEMTGSGESVRNPETAVLTTAMMSRASSWYAAWLPRMGKICAFFAAGFAGVRTGQGSRATFEWSLRF